MRLLLFIALFLVLISCKQRNHKPVLITEALNYSSYAWYPSSKGWDFYLNNLVQIDKNGHYNAVYRDSATSKLQYFQGILNDSLYNLINEVFKVDTFKADYKAAELDGIAYDGYTYCIDVTKSRGYNKKTIFIQDRSPVLLRKVSLKLDSLIKASKTRSFNNTDIQNYIVNLQTYSAATLPPLLQVDTTLFQSPKVQK